MYWIGEIAHQIALIPLVWLAWLSTRGQSRDAAYWWLASAFAVSWLADLAADVLPPDTRWIASLVYPVTQASIVGAVFLTRKDALYFAVVLLAAGVVAAVWRGPLRPDLLVHSIAMLGVTGIVVDRWALGLLRASLLVYFGLGWVAWLAYTIVPGWTTWGLYQVARLVGLVVFCRAVMKPTPSLRVA